MTVNPPPPPAPRLRLRVTAAAEKPIRAGHPWVFSESLREQNRPGVAGELAAIYDRNDKFFAIGFYDPQSPIRVRILHVGKPLAIDETFWRGRLVAALARRREWFDAQTTGYRLINGESDGWPGLVLDRYEQTCVLKIYTAAWFEHLTGIVHLIREHLHPELIVLRLSRKLAASDAPRTDGEILFQGGSAPPRDATVIFQEHGLRLEADVWRGQKTGFFLDQRENRRQVEALAAHRSVLNAFSFSGGFSLYAARGGATSVTDLDLSAHALAAARRNFALNQNHPTIAACRHEQIQADAFQWLAHNPDRKFDLVILDPPSLARRETERAGAIRAYEKLAGTGIAHLRRNGILVACSCSGHVSQEEFFGAVRAAARRSERRLLEWQTTGQPPDHPATFKEAAYLKAIYLRERGGK